MTNDIPKVPKGLLEVPMDLNTKLNFEKRVLYPDQYPVLENPDGSYSTHNMAWTSIDGKYLAFPTVVQLSNGDLQRLDPAQAIRYALRNKEYRTFNDPKIAEAYANGAYKRYWGKGLKGTD